MLTIYRMERRRLLSNCNAHRTGMGLGRNTRKFRQRELAHFRAAWRSVVMGAV
jgi:hypothetical protein